MWCAAVSPALIVFFFGFHPEKRHKTTTYPEVWGGFIKSTFYEGCPIYMVIYTKLYFRFPDESCIGGL